MPVSRRKTISALPYAFCHSSVDRIRLSHARLPAISSNPLTSAKILELSFFIAAERLDPVTMNRDHHNANAHFSLRQTGSGDVS
jgi:hypothetical protein